MKPNAILSIDGQAPPRPDPGRPRTLPPPRAQLDAVSPVPATTRRLVIGWLGLALGSLVVAGFFAMLAAFARTPVVYRFFSAALFPLALTSHVTFAFTVWFVAFAGVLWVYVAWRSGYPLSARASWTALALATAGAAAMAVPAFLASGKAYLNDYLPVIDHPFFWAGLVLLGAGVSLQATAYLAAAAAALLRRRSGRAPAESPEGLAMAIGALAVLVAAAAFTQATARVDPAVPFGYSLRAVVWGGGHILQFLHVAGMAAGWLVALAVALGAAPPARRVVRLLLATLAPFAVAAGAAYLLWRPEALLTNHLITILTFGGLGAGAVPLLFMAVAAAAPAPRPLPWGSPLFGGTVVSFALFAIGGVMGLIGFTQDTRVPAHYHGMVGAVTLSYMALTPLLLGLTGRRPLSERWARWQPYLYGVGLLGIMAGMHWAGGHGAPRKTFGFSWANAQALIGMNLMGLGSVLAIAGGLAFVINMGLPLLRRLPTGGGAGPRAERGERSGGRAMIAAYVESLKLRVGTFIGMAAVLGYVATAPAGPSLASLGLLFAVTLTAAGGAGALNHFLDRDLDARMPRTARRPLPSGKIRHGWHVVALGLGLVALAVSVATWRLNRLVALHLFLGAFTYVVIYTIWLKRRSWLNVVIGGLAGSFAVLAGGALARPELCLPPVIFAAVLFFWSPSHFWSLAIAYKSDYAGARIPMLPAVKGEVSTARSILVNTIGLLASSVLPFALGLLGWPYLIVAVAAGGGLLLARNLALLRQPTNRTLALANFHASNLFLLLLFAGVILDVGLRRW